jgi:hypothetical protein
MTDACKKRGVYFLANDHVYDLAVAFLNSFRRHNPAMPLCLIPFRSDIARLKSLAPIFHFNIYDDDDYLAECDAISEQFHGRVVGQYRKLAIWNGAFDEFIFIDVDTVVLHSLDFAFEFLSDYEFVVSISDIPFLLDWVWKDVADLVDKLDARQIGYAANTGFIVSTRGMLGRDEVRSKVDAAVALRDNMNLHCYEQPFFNYLIITSGKRYSSLVDIKLRRNRPDIPEEAWAGMQYDGVTLRDGYVYLNDDPDPANFAFVHWNGVWRLHDRPEVDGPTQDENMPHRELWQYYRDMRF